MADTTTNLNRKQTDPQLSDLLSLWAKQIKLSMNCHAVATVQSFNAENQTITATINYKKSYLRKGDNDIYSTVLIDYPVLLDVPVIVMGGGKFNLSFPITKGDECLIMFNDRSIDNWFQSGQVLGLASNRLHSFSDGIALVGLKSLAHSMADYDEARAKLFYKNGASETMVGVSATKVKIANPTTSLNTLLATLIDTINAITTTNAVVGAPCALSPTSIAALNAVKTQIAGLLE